MKTWLAGLLMAAAAAFSAHPTSAQQGRLNLSVGAGAGYFTPTCDTDCRGDRLGANAIIGYLGWTVKQRVRVEVGAERTQSTDDGSGTTGGYYAKSTLAVGVSVYATRSLFIRGGVATSLAMEVPDVSENPLGGDGGPGFSVGAGYDIHFGQGPIAITPYVSVFGGSFSEIKYDFAGIQTPASVLAIHGGVFFTLRPQTDS